ncbi:MAG: phosphoribosylamine--glycine ligase [Flavobacteriales bacterium]|nr:phosphoribosylamine--glycine ligase [Flavobacteriales bacterium]|tara:strand:- start:1971 stop:3242 length:1272 start_codon:yes stop_codon:yes gene_type:complete
MNVLILGSGGRENAFAWKIAKSSSCGQLYICPGNAGTRLIGKNINISLANFDEIKTFVLNKNIEMVIVGPEDPLVNGIYDFFKQDDLLKKISVIGPSKKGAQLEGSKKFAKEFMLRNSIPTAKYKSFDKSNLSDGFNFLESLESPYVLKADGLAAGKGVVIINDVEEAKKELSSMILDGKFGCASRTVVIEEFLDGIEMSVFILTDGESYKILPSAKDYKQIGENNTGLNTGGMGAISPVPFLDRFYLEKIENEIIKPTILGLKKESIEYVGFIFFGLINVNDEPKVIEYNVRMGDPETEVVIPRIKSDLLNLLKGIKDGTFSEKDLNVDDEVAATVMLTSGGYPEKYSTGYEISGVEDVDSSIVFHAGTKFENEKLITSGGRVMSITSFGKTMEDALKNSYESVSKINFKGKYYRTDIGFDL